MSTIIRPGQPVIIGAAQVWLLTILHRLFDGKIIVNCEREPYLYRWYLIKREWLSVFLHKFVRSDEDRALHDHPWSFVVIPIWRGYIEHSDVENPLTGERSLVKHRVYPLISSRWRQAEYRHRVELLTDQHGQLLPSWSIFIHFKRRRLWGMWPSNVFTAWNKWWQEKCE